MDTQRGRGHTLRRRGGHGDTESAPQCARTVATSPPSPPSPSPSPSPTQTFLFTFSHPLSSPFHHLTSVLLFSAPCACSIDTAGRPSRAASRTNPRALPKRRVKTPPSHLFYAMASFIFRTVVLVCVIRAASSGGIGDSCARNACTTGDCTQVSCSPACYCSPSLLTCKR